MTARTHIRGRSPAASSKYPPRIKNRALLTSRRTCARTSLSGSQSITASASSRWMSPAIWCTDLRAASPSTAVNKSPSPDPAPPRRLPDGQCPRSLQPRDKRPRLRQQVVLRQHAIHGVVSLAGGR